MAKSYINKLTTCPRKAPKANIHWQSIPMGSTIMECGKADSRYFVVRMATPAKPKARYAVVYWGSQDAHQAQAYLQQRTEWYQGLRGSVKKPSLAMQLDAAQRAYNAAVDRRDKREMRLQQARISRLLKKRR